MHRFKLILFVTLLSIQIAHADNDSSFPFDNECLKFDKATFKEGGALLDVMKSGDFPQYCYIYSLAKYQVTQKRDDGYFITAAATTVFLKTKKSYQENQPLNQSVYFTGQERFMMTNAQETELYTFQEIDSSHE
jgi:hypothetical protein